MTRYFPSIKPNIKPLWGALTNKKTPLVLSVLAQAYVLFIWLSGWEKAKLSAELQILTVVFAIITAVSLDSIIVSTTFSKGHSAWSILTGIVALMGSVLIVIDLFYGLNFHWLHAVFPVMVFMYSQHLRKEIELEENAKYTQLDKKGWDKATLLTSLVSAGLDNETIYKVVRGDRTKLWKQLAELRDSVNTQ